MIVLVRQDNYLYQLNNECLALSPLPHKTVVINPPSINFLVLHILSKNKDLI